jgi:hypothetical protein
MPEANGLAYAGVGSRATPANVLLDMHALASVLGKAGWTLRTGNADGADTAFFDGAEHVRGHTELYLPWPGFGPAHRQVPQLYLQSRPDKPAYDLARAHHPAWVALNGAARALHARNVHQVLGRNLKAPAAFVVCWTLGAKGGGGTGQAIRLAHAYNVPVYDLGAGPRVLVRLLQDLELAGTPAALPGPS